MTHERRFFAETFDTGSGRVTFSAPDAAHMKRSLRLHPGSRIVAVDKCGAEYEVELKTLTAREARATVVKQLSEPSPVRTDLWLIQALPKGRHKADLIVRQTTEIGIDHIRFVRTERSETRLHEDRVPYRVERWNRVAREAASQSRRLRVPSVGVHSSLDAAIDELPEACGGLVAWEDEPTAGLAECVRQLGPEPAAVAIFVGPEGGFSPAECEFLESRRARPFRLGSTVLRTETAAPVVTALVRYELGLM